MHFTFEANFKVLQSKSISIKERLKKTNIIQIEQQGKLKVKGSAKKKCLYSPLKPLSSLWCPQLVREEQYV